MGGRISQPPGASHSPRAPRRRPGSEAGRPAPGAKPEAAPAIAPPPPRAARAASRTQRLAALGSLLGDLAHELRNTLVGVKTFLELLPDSDGDPEEREAMRHEALAELRRAERLLAGVVAEARGARREEQEGARTGDPAQAVERVVRLCAPRAAEAGIELRARTTGRAPRVTLGADALHQVLVNLVENALDATPRGGEVLVDVRDLGPAVELRVADRGPGVPRELRHRIFEAGFSTKEDGAGGGLGLAIARSLVESAGGTLTLGARRGGGAVFRVRLPRA